MKRLGHAVLRLVGLFVVLVACVSLVIGFVSLVHFVSEEVESGSGVSAAQRQAMAEAKECRAVARQAEEGKIPLNAGNYYLKCLRPGVSQQALIRKYEVRSARESEESQRAVAREKGEAEARESALQREQERAKRQAEERLGAP